MMVPTFFQGMIPAKLSVVNGFSRIALDEEKAESLDFTWLSAFIDFLWIVKWWS
ncbi:MAG: hypothetical protein LBV23_04200 [Deltaproteobacteria bacterium]|nr:hypothetical protein [Deltaproteobacteria bacterium]